MIDIKELRRLAQAAIAKMNASDPEFASSTPPLAILELLDRLEAAEKDITIKEEVIDSLAVVVKRLDAQCDAAEKERDALRAENEQMERQGPGFRERCTPSAPTGCSNRFPLYALPGAKGE